MSTTIRISRDTKRMLEESAHKGQTFDDIVRKGAIALFNDEHHHTYNVPMFNGSEEAYIQVRVPKSVKKLAINEEGLVEAVRSILEENDIEEIEDPRTGVSF